MLPKIKVYFTPERYKICLYFCGVIFNQIFKTMKKKVLSIIGVAAVGAAVAFNINAGLQNNSELDVALSKIEAIAESEGATITCSISSCHGKFCHTIIYSLSCPCVATGWMRDQCPL